MLGFQHQEKMTQISSNILFFSQPPSIFRVMFLLTADQIYKIDFLGCFILLQKFQTIPPNFEF